MVYVKTALKNMIQDTELVFRDPHLDHNSSLKLKGFTFKKIICVYVCTYIYMLYLGDL